MERIDGNQLVSEWEEPLGFLAPYQWDSALLNVTLDGKADVLIRSGDPEIWHAVPSPDGHWLAIAGASGPRNVWQLEGF